MSIIVGTIHPSFLIIIIIIIIIIIMSINYGHDNVARIVHWDISKKSWPSCCR